jgi:P-type conjugative transfer protein TrbJ
MRKLRPTAFAVTFSVMALCQVGKPSRAEAQVLVYDAVNWWENAAQVIQQAYEIYQKAQQLVNDVKRYETMLKNLERFDELSFQDLVGLVATVDDLLRQGDSLGHTLADIDAQFAATFPGYQPILSEEFLSVFQYRNGRTLETMRRALDALQRVSANNLPSHELLAILQTNAEGADGNLEALQAVNEFLHYQAGQLAQISQQLSLQANVEAVYAAYQVDREAADRATSSLWLRNGVAPVPPYDASGGARGVPFGGPFVCVGCGGRP